MKFLVIKIMNFRVKKKIQDKKSIIKKCLWMSISKYANKYKDEIISN